MIRDPSDGSVRGKLDSSELSRPPMAGSGAVIDSATSGLREPSSKSDYLARLDRSREWLAKYRTGEIINHLIGEDSQG